jgi:uncharacterized protein YkwD
LLLITACALFLPAATQARTQASFRSSTERVMLKLLNTIRRDHGLRPFKFSVALRESAREHSADMLEHQYFEHNSPTQTFDKRIRHFYNSPLVGEDIAWGTGRYSTPQGLVGLWMHSATHRHIILMRSLTRIGLGVAVGKFEGSPGAAMATADFAE